MIESKKCSNCKELKTIDQFYKDKNRKDGLFVYCKDCFNIRVVKYRRTIKGLITEMYSLQRASSKKRNMNLPNYSKVEFEGWILKQPNFDSLFKSWIDSGYSKMLKPSVDRHDDYKPYTLDNIQLIKWQENNSKNYEDTKTGTNKKRLRAVISYNEKTKDIIEYYSMAEASRQTGISASSIFDCCNNKQKTAAGFIWKYSREK